MIATSANVNPCRIILAREARGMSQLQLATAIRMSPTNLSKIERGEVGVSLSLIDQIAEKTFFPQHFFMVEGRTVPENLTYRRRQTVAQKLLTPIHARINIYREHVQFLTRALNVAAPAIPRMQVTEKQSPQRIAARLRKEWQVETPVLNDLARLLEDLNLPIVSFDFGTERVDSRSILTDDQHPVIFINQCMAGDRQRFSLAYELGMLVMHTHAELTPGRDITGEANAFAASFLMPEKEIRKAFEQGITIPVLAALKKEWKVSMIALLYRADDLGLLTPNQKRYLLQQFNQLNIRRREPVELDVRSEEPTLVRRWVSTYRSKTGLSTTEMAAVLCLNPDEFIEQYS